MDNTIKSLIARVWKNEALQLDAGEHFFDEVLTVHVSGTVTKHSDQMAAPTTSLPLIPILALFWEKCGVSRDHALRMLREAITEAMETGKDKDERIEARIKDVEKAVEAVKKDLIAKLPKQKRSGRVVTKGLHVEVVPIEEDALSPAAA
jgi:hypothetical protein